MYSRYEIMRNIAEPFVHKWERADSLQRTPNTCGGI